MQKMLLLLPLVGLAACGASENIADDEKLTPGIMQPVSDSGATEGSYSMPSDIQTAPMPASMSK